MPEKFNIATASKAECLEKANKLLDLGVKAEEFALKMVEGSDRDIKTRQVEFALRNACKNEDAAFDGRQ